jgi:transposase
MKPTYLLGIDAAKHKIRVALSDLTERILFEKDLPVNTAGLRALLARVQAFVPDPEQLLVLIEATGVLHLNWSAALTRAGYSVAVINPLIARRLYRLENSIRDNKSDPIDARELCGIARKEGEKLLALYRFRIKPEQFCLQRLQSVRKAVRKSLSNLKKSYRSLLDLSFPELGELLEIDGVGIRQLLAQGPTPAAIARRHRSTLEKNWMLRPKAAVLKKLAATSIADPELAQASAPALLAMLQSIAAIWKRAWLNWIVRLKPLARKASMPKAKPCLKPSPALDRLVHTRFWPFCLTRFCTPAAIAKRPLDFRPLWATIPGYGKVASAKGRPK